MDKKMEKAEELLAAALQGDKKFMDGLRRNKCNTTETEVDFVDGVSGEQNIANKFKDFYSDIYILHISRGFGKDLSKSGTARSKDQSKPSSPAGCDKNGN